MGGEEGTAEFDEGGVVPAWGGGGGGGALSNEG